MNGLFVRDCLSMNESILVFGMPLECSITYVTSRGYYLMIECQLMLCSLFYTDTRIFNTIYLNKFQGSHRLEKYLNIQGFLEKSFKIKFALKSTGKAI